MSDRDIILNLNRGFYQAFTGRDYAAMDELWADGLPVSCIHPGWPPLFGRDEVMMSWRDLLRAPPGEAIRARAETVNLYGDTALVLCEEVLGERTVLAAANLFVREDGQWRMVHHQAGPMSASRAGKEPQGGGRRSLH